MNTDHLEEFIYLSETLSFTKTAERFYTSRSVISRHIAALESELGVRLLDRDRHNVSLTKEGTAFKREASVLVRDFRRLLESTREASDGEDRVVRIGYMRNAARPFIVHFANYFREHFGHIHPVFSCMKYDELCKAMADNLIDLAFSMDFAGQLEGRYASVPIYEDKLYAVMSKSDPLAASEAPLASEQLVGRRLLLSDSLACHGLNEYLVDAFGPKSAFISFEYFDDADVTQLRLRVDGSIALRSGYNVFLSGDDTVALEISDVDLSFTANAYYIDDMDAETERAVLETVADCTRLMDSRSDEA